MTVRELTAEQTRGFTPIDGFKLHGFAGCGGVVYVPDVHHPSEPAYCNVCESERKRTMSKNGAAAKSTHEATARAPERDPVLSWTALKFRAAVRAALVAASSDTDRPSLCSVCVRRRNGVLTVSATDGHWLFRWTEPEGQTDESGATLSRAPFQCLVPRRSVESFIDATKKHVELEHVLLTGAGHRWQLETIMDICKVEFLQVAESYPDLDDVIPTVVAPTSSSIGLGANMMSRVAKAFALATGDPESTVFWQLSGDHLSPLVCTSPTHPELVAVVMPRRSNAEDANAVPEKRGEADTEPPGPVDGETSDLAGEMAGA